ncbi:MAG: hypothetical protein QOF78_4369 [Phycisphaerales bacterium]|jgi:hypothetical protein|nr:hypothetical protein [Phycisphaerales bacterium]
MRNALILIGAIALSIVGVIGCSGRPALIPNPDKNLRKASAQFAADAASRHPYKAEAPRGGEAIARSQVGYTLDRLDVINLSKQEWKDVEIWVNQKYVVFLPKVEPNTLKIINFQMLFDGKGNYFPTDNNKVMISKVEVLKDGKMYDLPVRLGD